MATSSITRDIFAILMFSLLAMIIRAETKVVESTNIQEQPIAHAAPSPINVNAAPVNHQIFENNYTSVNTFCFDFIYPVQLITPNHQVQKALTADQIDTAILTWSAQNPNSNEELILDFPVKIKFDDGVLSSWKKSKIYLLLFSIVKMTRWKNKTLKKLKLNRLLVHKFNTSLFLVN